MDLVPSEEQRLLRETAERFVTDRYPFAMRSSFSASPDGFSREVWRDMAALGWLRLPLPELDSGFGGGAVEVGILMEAFGRGLMLEPFLPTVLLGAGLVAAAGTKAQRAAILPDLGEGKLLLAFAHVERQARFRLEDVATLARRDGASWKLGGEKIVVLGGPSADRLVVSARIAGARCDRAGIGLFVVPRNTPGIGARDYQLVDSCRAANFTFEDVLLGSDALLGGSEDALPVIEAVVDRTLAALVAEAVGIMQMLVDKTVAYTKSRQQFGRSIAANQVVRHRLVDMAIQLEEARSIALLAALRADAVPTERGRSASGAKAKVARCALLVGEQAIQLHGAMGVTEELEIGAYFKRLLAIETIFGDAEHHLRRHAALGRSRAVA